MGKDTSISWTDATFNPVHGCTKVSPGCDHCFAETFDKRIGGGHWGKGKPRRTFGDSHWNEPLAWNRICEKENEQWKVFCGSMCDVMDDEWPTGARERLWELIDATPHLTWQLLTKRPQRYSRYLPKNGFKHKNVWLGASAENQDMYLVRWPYLRLSADDIGAVSFISYEPALGPLSIASYARRLENLRSARDPTLFAVRPEPSQARFVPDWIIFGGESGPGRRPMELKWAEDLKAECEIWKVAFFMKQMSAKTPGDGAGLIPPHLLIRQFPGEDNNAT